MTKSLADLWLWPLHLAETTGAVFETLYNTNVVLAARLPIIATAVTAPFGDTDHRELGLMVSEKVDAFTQSGQSFERGRRSVAKVMTANARDLGKISAGSAWMPGDWFDLAARNLALWSTLATLPGDMLRPVRTRVASNAKRLRR